MKICYLINTHAGYIKPLRKLLRGKTCFHMRAADEAMLENVRLAVDAGTQLYRDRGWL